MRIRKSPVERARRQRLKTLPPLALEFSRLMSDVFGERAAALDPSEVKALRTKAASIAKMILAEIEELRWDQGISPEMRQLLESTKRKMLSDARIKGLLKDEGVLPTGA